MAQLREPHKGVGVPRETRVSNSLRALCAAAGPAMLVSRSELQSEIEADRYYEAPMQQQLLIAARVLLRHLPPTLTASRDLVDRLGASDVERVRGVAPAIAMLRYQTELKTCLKLLRRAGKLAGAWPQEQAQGFVHQLVIKHGFHAVNEVVRPWLACADPLVRRLVVEAMRPRGVMIAQIQELRTRPELLHPMLDLVLDDPSVYVQKAAANCLNDISRDNPDVVLDWCETWSAGASSPQRQWVLSRGLRTLVKGGVPRAMRLAGLGAAEALEIASVGGVPSAVEINQLLPLCVTLRNRGTTAVKARVQVRMDCPGRANKTRQRTYLVQSILVPANGSRTAEKQLHFTHSNAQEKLPGLYTLKFEANGRCLAERTFRFGP